jgi:hypothetical protein
MCYVCSMDKKLFCAGGRSCRSCSGAHCMLQKPDARSAGEPNRPKPSRGSHFGAAKSPLSTSTSSVASRQRSRALSVSAWLKQGPQSHLLSRSDNPQTCAQKHVSARSGCMRPDKHKRAVCEFSTPEPVPSIDPNHAMMLAHQATVVAIVACTRASTHP